MLATLALSSFDWWREAGVDTAIDEAPRNWLAPERAATPDAATPAQAAPVDQALPADLAAFRAWLLADASVPGHATQRFDAIGDAASGTVIVIDMPEAGDRTAGQLLSGEAGALFDRMLVPMGLSRDLAYLIPFAPARPASGRLDPAAVAALTPLARHHLGLAKPRRLLLLGDAPVRALLDIGVAEARGRTHAIEIGGVPVPTITSFHPRFILQASPADLKRRRAAVWADLQQYMAL
ncbi:DNA polymerase [Sphingomonas vulcanisoli]|uniref:DNA polymerase n=1 Tax=Sphingomonas vulcanisoli TaxID=1658060 RepID=A0ABX0TLS8_9SPHN|nr:uracil-DNA glycosylase family protein [Sphingomonas vulcanisoli]NIJ06472.1 DNA polymerase [Sphingomonas vulcanisoli]